MENEKYTKDEALAKIKILIKNFYENSGREIFKDFEMKHTDLLNIIEEILNRTDISIKQLIIESLTSDRNMEKELKDLREHWNI